MSDAVGFEANTGLAWELGKSGLRQYLLEAHRETGMWLSALVLVTGTTLGLIDHALFGGCVPVQKQLVLV